VRHRRRKNLAISRLQKTLALVYRPQRAKCSLFVQSVKVLKNSRFPTIRYYIILYYLRAIHWSKCERDSRHREVTRKFYWVFIFTDWLSRPKCCLQTFIGPTFEPKSDFILWVELFLKETALEKLQLVVIHKLLPASFITTHKLFPATSSYPQAVSVESIVSAESAHGLDWRTCMIRPRHFVDYNSRL